MAENNKILAVLICLALADIFVWAEISGFSRTGSAEIYFLDVGQGDSELVVFPDGAKALIDGGPGRGAVLALDSVISQFDRRVDLLILSHPEKDHFSGMADVLKRYETGAFIWSGQLGQSEAFNDLIGEISRKKIKIVSVSAGDRVRQGDSVFEVLSPRKENAGAMSANEASLVLRFFSNGGEALFTGDIGFSSEKTISSGYDLSGTDVLKVAHHGSKNSSGKFFLAYFSPSLAVIEVGKNSYGHPAKETLSNLASAGAQILRTDENGTIKVVFKNGKMEIFKEKISP
jgi:competence protein ComEC